MNRTGRYIILLLVIMSIVTVAAGCRIQNNTVSTSEESVGEMNEMMLYYINNQWSDYSIKRVDMDQLATTENLIDSVVKSLIEGGGSESQQSPVPAGMSYQRYTYNGAGTVTLIFSVDWENTASYDMILCKSAFVRSLCQIQGVSSVAYEMADIVNENNVVREEYSEESFFNLDSVLNSSEESAIYIPGEEGKTLVKKVLMLDLAAVKTPEEQVIDGLRASYDGARAALNPDVVVENIEVKDGLCTVTFSSQMMRGTEGIDDEITIYSIVDSLVQLSDVERVKIIINDSRDNSINTTRLSDEYTGNYSRVER